jgi:hypothetical protein
MLDSLIWRFCVGEQQNGTRKGLYSAMDCMNSEILRILVIVMKR